MGIVRKSAYTLLYTYLGFTIGLVNTLWLFPLALSAEQIGLTRLLINVALLFSTFAALGTSQVIIWFFPYFKDKEKRHNGFLFFIFTVSTSGFIIFLIAFLLLKGTFFSIYLEKAKLLTDYFYYLIPLTFFTLYFNIFESYNTIQQRPVYPSFLRESLTRFLMTIGVLAYFFSIITFHSFINTILLAYGLVLVFIIIYTKRTGSLFIKPNFSVFKSNKIKEIWVYIGFIFMANVSGVIIQNVDSLVLSAYSGLRSAGIYTIAFFIATVIDAPRRSMSQVITPLVSEANKINDIPKLEMLYKKSSINQMVIGGLIFLLIWCNIDNIFNLIPHGEVFKAGKWVVFYLGLSKLFDMASGINTEIVGTSKYYKFDLPFYIGLGLLAIFLNLLFIHWWGLGLMGAAYASALTVFVYNLVRFILLLWKMKIQPFSFNTLKAISIFLITLAVNYIINFKLYFIIDIVLRSIIIAVIFCGLNLLFKISEDINNLFYNTYLKIIKKTK